MKFISDEIILGDNRLIADIKNLPSLLGVVNESPHPSYVLTEHSNLIDAANILKKYSRVPRKITSEEFFQLHVMSQLLRLSIRLLKQIEGDFVLVNQLYDEIPAALTTVSNIFWTDNHAFLWYYEHLDRWTFRLGCRIRISQK